MPEAIVHHRAYVAFSAGIHAEDSTLIDKWEAMAKEWNEDRTKPCPYELPAGDCK